MHGVAIGSSIAVHRTRLVAVAINCRQETSCCFRYPKSWASSSQLQWQEDNNMNSTYRHNDIVVSSPELNQWLLYSTNFAFLMSVPLASSTVYDYLIITHSFAAYTHVATAQSSKRSARLQSLQSPNPGFVRYALNGNAAPKFCKRDTFY